MLAIRKGITQGNKLYLGYWKAALNERAAEHERFFKYLSNLPRSVGIRVDSNLLTSNEAAAEVMRGLKPHIRDQLKGATNGDIVT